MSGSLEHGIEWALARLHLGRVLPALAVVLFLIAWNRGIALLYGMLALILAVWIVALAAPRRNLAGVAAQRRIPASATEGETIPLELSVSCPRGRRYMLELRDRLPFAPPGLQDVFAFVPQLKGEIGLRYEIPCDLRGEHRLGPLHVATSYPLGVRTAARTLADSEARILVYPATFPMRRLPLASAVQMPVTGARSASLQGGHDEFFGVREYRHGDSPRRIHWPASARRGELVVREYQPIHKTDLLIVLDLRHSAQYGEGKHSTLEYAVKIAASAARHALDEGHRVGLAGFGAGASEVPVDRSPMQFRRILEVLARVRADGSLPYAEAVHRSLGKIRRGGAVLLFDHAPSGHARPAEDLDLYRRHVRPIWVRFDTASFRDFAGHRAYAAGAGEYRVRRGDDLAKVFAR